MITFINPKDFLIFFQAYKANNEIFTHFKSLIRTCAMRLKLRNYVMLNSFFNLKINLCPQINYFYHATNFQHMYMSHTKFMEGVCSKF